MRCIVIVLRGCQPAFLGCYGNDWLPTTSLDRLASEAVVFDWHFLDRWSVTRSWLTGRYGPASGATDLPSLVNLLASHGVAATLIADERSPRWQSPFAIGWERAECVRQSRLEELEQENLLGGTVQTAIEWLRANAARPRWLLWLELSELVPPWEPSTHDAEALEGLEEASIESWFAPPDGMLPEEGRDPATRRLQATYGGVMAGVDQWLGMLFEALAAEKLDGETCLIVTGDRGLPLGEHGLVGDQQTSLHEETAHIPLIVRLPQREGAGRRVHQLTQPVDLLPTLAELYRIDGLPTFQGKSILPVARGSTPRVREYACSWGPAGGGPGEWSIRTHQWCFIMSRASAAGTVVPPRLFVKPDDRWEVHNVAGQHPEVAEHLELALHRFHHALRANRLTELPDLREEILKIIQN